MVTQWAGVAEGSSLTGGGQMIQVVAAVLLVAVLAVLTTRLLAKRLAPGLGGKYIRVVESVGLGPNRMLCLVQVNGRMLLLGVTDRDIRRLAVVPGTVGPITEQREEPAGVFDRVLSAVTRTGSVDKGWDRED